MDLQLHGKTVLITGGASGIGLAAATLFVAQGAAVVIVGRDEAAMTTATSALGPRATSIRADVRSLDQLAAAREQLAANGTRLDGLFVNAGVAFATPVADVSSDRYDELMDINVKGAFFSVQAFLPLLNRGSSIVMNTSWLAEVGTAGLSVLSASKAAVRSFTRTLAAELLPSGIRVNAVSPGAMDTPIHAKTGMSPEQLAAFAAGLQQRIPLGRFGSAQDVAAAALFLISDASSYMLGAEIAVDGGFAQL